MSEEYTTPDALTDLFEAACNGTLSESQRAALAQTREAALMRDPLDEMPQDPVLSAAQSHLAQLLEKRDNAK